MRRVLGLLTIILMVLVAFTAMPVYLKPAVVEFVNIAESDKVYSISNRIVVFGGSCKFFNVNITIDDSIVIFTDVYI